MNSYESSGPARQVALPANLTLTSRDGRLELSRRWSLLGSAILPGLCCFGPCGLYGQALVDGTVQNISNGRVTGYIKLPWLGYPMMAIAMLCSAVLLYLFLASLVNRTVVRVEPGRLRVFNRPLPWPYGSVELTPEDISHFETTPGLRVKQGGKDVVKPTDIMLVVDRQGRKHQVAPGLESHAQFAWLEAQLRRTLGMPVPVTADWPLEALAQSTAEEPQPETAPPAEERAPRSLEERLVRGLISHGLGYVASTQRVYAVVGHFGWLMLSIIGLQEGASGQVGRLMSSRLLDLYAMLGGVNEHGRGGTAELMAVWGKVALIIYLVGLVLSWARGPRRPWGLRRKWAASTLLAFVGYGVAAVLLARTKVGGRIGDMLVVMAGFVVFTSVMTWWALGVGKFMRSLQERLGAGRAE
ncbi:MAG TPA: hypothetical protein VK539_11325 [Myxococcaceae bacterium]|nr:hypothetical protein [Myxococcaceae bacterium]